MSSAKRIIIFCDGTGMDGTLAPSVREARALSDTGTQDIRPTIMFDGLTSNAKRGDSDTVTDINLSPPIEGAARALLNTDNFVPHIEAEDPPDNGGGRSEGQNATNILRLSRGVKRISVNGTEQIVFYQSGVGSEANFDGKPITESTTMKAFGTAVASKIRDAYAFIAQNYGEGDEISIFGFSRGAYTARKLAGLIDTIGLLQTQSLGHFFQIWRQLVDNKSPSIPEGTRKPRIKCVGVWDTVGSVYGAIDALSIKDTSLPQTVDYALHAMSLQENREKFLPTLWSVPTQGLAAGQVLKQVWFPGAHSDVGGGYKSHDLADLALFWMAGEVEHFIDLNLDFIKATQEKDPKPWGTAQPNNAYHDLSLAEKYIIGHKTRLESGQITRDAQFHSSILGAPTTLTKPKYMVTLPILHQKFGGSWTPTTPSLNEFEKRCKKDWISGTLDGVPEPEFENAEDLF